MAWRFGLTMQIGAPWNDRLAEPLAREHIVQIYRDDRAVVEAVSLFAGHGLGKGEGVILVATVGHLEAVEARLGASGFDLGDLEAWGQLTTFDAARLLSHFFVGGHIDAARFRTTVDDVLTRAHRGGRFPRLRVYGEMVNLLWRANPAATRQIEELWNEAIERHEVSLLCGYRMEAGETSAHFPRDLRTLHSHFIPVEAVL